MFGSVLLITTLSLAMQFSFLWFSSSVLGKTGLDPCCSFLITLSENLERKAVSALRFTFPSLTLSPKYTQSLARPSFGLCRMSLHVVFICTSCGGGDSAPCEFLSPSPISLKKICHHLPVSHINSVSICPQGCSNVHRAIDPLGYRLCSSSSLSGGMDREERV